MARPTGLHASQLTLVRSKTGAPAAADSGTLTDANILPTEALNCFGCETIWVGVELTGGTSPTVVLEVLVRDADAADGSRWKKLLVGSADGVTAAAAASAKTAALDGTALQEVRVSGRTVFLRVDTVANNPTGIGVLAMGGKPRLPTARP